MFCIGALVAVQHEYAHAFAAAKLGYRLNKIVLMPYGAVIDGDIQKLSLKDELSVALAGPLANAFTAAFFVAVWWLYPTVYAFTDVACFASLSVALVNLIPAYPLDGGRIFKCLLTRALQKRGLSPTAVKRRADTVCLIFSLTIAAALLAVFICLCVQKTYNYSLLLFAVFLALGAVGNKKDRAGYVKIDFTYREAFKRGVEIKRVALSSRCTFKRALTYFESGKYLILEVYDDKENYLGELPQNELSALLLSKSVYTPIGDFFNNFDKNAEF